MSYDVQLWVVEEPFLETLLRPKDGWKQGTDSWVKGARKWQLVVTKPANVEPEDVPEVVAQALPGIGYLVAVSLEPLGAPEAAHRLLRQATKAIARVAHGAVFDPQTDEIILPSGVRRYQAPLRRESFSLLELSWFFTDSPLHDRNGPKRFVDALATLLPEALPRRYGEYEPPQYRLEETGIDRFVDFMNEHRADTKVWYPNRPVASVSLVFDEHWGWERRGFRANYITLAIEEGAMAQPGWGKQLQRVWHSLSMLIRPFYGDVRTLGGYSRFGATVGIGPDTERHPVQAWWWRGIPRSIGHASVIGHPYLELWPAFTHAATVEEGLAFLSKLAWEGSEDVSAAIGGIPEELVQPEAGYSVSWPFEKPAEG